MNIEGIGESSAFLEFEEKSDCSHSILEETDQKLLEVAKAIFEQISVMNALLLWKACSLKVQNNGQQIEDSFYRTTQKSNERVICSGNSVGASESVDSEGNAQVEGHVTHTEDHEGGSSSWNVTGEVNRDSDGNVTAEVRGGCDYRF